MFSSTQSGFRNKHMTSEQLLRLSEECHQSFKSGKNVAALFLDAEAAFDQCWHNGIKYKLKKNLGLPNRIIRLVTSFLTNRSLTVVHEGHHSHQVRLEAGTPQGSPLSPLIYVLYVNDYPKEIQYTSTLSQFADDSALWASAYTRAMAIRKVQKSLNNLEVWCRKWRVKLNGEKSHLLFISRTREKCDENYAIQLFNDTVRPTNCAKFLGIEIDSQLSFRNHFDSIHARASKRLSVLRVLSSAKTEPAVLLKLYKIYIRPLFEYGSSAFVAASRTQLSRLQNIQNEAIRISLRLPKYIRCSLLQEYSGMESITERLTNLNKVLIQKMIACNPHVRSLVENHVPDNYSHLSPLDVIEI